MFAYIAVLIFWGGGTGGHSSLFMSWLNFRGKTVYVESGKEEKKAKWFHHFSSYSWRSVRCRSKWTRDMNQWSPASSSPVASWRGKKRQDSVCYLLAQLLFFFFPKDENIFPKKEEPDFSAFLFLFFKKTLSTPCFPRKGVSLVIV